MTLASQEFVELDRRFDRVTGSDFSEGWAAAILSGETKPRNWAWLRDQSRVVALLAQAGSGKTAEFMHQVDIAREAGRDAFFFRVERLCSGVLDEAHESPDCKSRFEAWLKSGRHAEIFLDSVDEAKLPQARTARPLQDALRALSFGLRPHYGRLSVLVSCRSSEWFEEVEQKALEALAAEMSFARPAQDVITVFNATFAPIDQPRIGLLAAARDVGDALETLVENEAIEDIQTPLDAILYLDAFAAFKGTPQLAAQFASRGKLLETSIGRRLKEQGGESRRSRLEFTAALKAARYLAFASVVAQSNDIAVGPARQGCIDPQELLTTGHAALSVDSVRQFLACSLFVPAGPARVRFYRPEARDMLAAQWLRDRIDEGASALSVSNRFIKSAFGRAKVPAAYGNMLAWLAAYDPLTRRRMIAVAPEWIIEGGDTRSLAFEDRLAALDTHFALGPNRLSGVFSFDVRELRRFARSDMEAAIVGRLALPPLGDLFDNLIKFVEAGRYPSAAPLLVTLLMDFTRSAGERMVAMRALMACGGTADFRHVAQHFVATGGPTLSATEPFAEGRSDQFLTDLIMVAYPEAIGVGEALLLCAQINGSNYSHVAREFADWLIRVAPDNDVSQWFVELDRLCFDGSKGPSRPFRNNRQLMHGRAKLLLRGLVDIAGRYISLGAFSEPVRDLMIYDRVCSAHDLGAAYAMSRQGSPIAPVLTVSRLFRQSLLEFILEHDRRPWPAYCYLEHLEWSLYRGDPLIEDVQRLLQRYRAQSHENRKVYANCAVALVDRLKPITRLAPYLTIIVAALGESDPDWQLARQVTLNPLARPWQRLRQRWQSRLAVLKPDVRDRLETVWSNLRHRIDCWQERDRLRQGLAVPLLVTLVVNNGLQVPTEAEVRGRLGRRMGDVVIEGARAFARRYSHTDEGGHVSDEAMLAMAGYQFDWNADLAMAGINRLSALEVALCGATDWPDWAGALALANPQQWVSVALPHVLGELATTRPKQYQYRERFLLVVAHLDEDLRALLAAPLFGAIQHLQVIDGTHVDQLVRILATDPNVLRQLPAFAKRHTMDAWFEAMIPRAFLWLPFWASGDTAGCLRLLSWMTADSTLIVEGLEAYLRAYGTSAGVAPAPLPIRARFAEFAYVHIHPKNDVPIKGGVHTRSPRDTLQELRGNVAGLLSIDFDDAERAALEHLIATYVAPVSQRWATGWRNDYERNAVKPGPWSQEAIIAAGRDLAEAPIDGAALYDRVSEMIADLERELATSEFDRRGLFSRSILESDFRAWLGHALDARRRPWFSIVQEAETASAKRTDLRLELRGGDGAVVVVEIKLLHGWTYDEIFDKFTSQLVDQYLLTPRVRHGIYLLVDLGKTPKGSRPGGTTPSAIEIVDELNAVPVPAKPSVTPIAKAQRFQIAPTARNQRRESRDAEKAAAKAVAKKAPAKASPKPPVKPQTRRRRQRDDD